MSIWIIDFVAAATIKGDLTLSTMIIGKLQS
jgi:hypothetical protein